MKYIKRFLWFILILLLALTIYYFYPDKKLDDSVRIDKILVLKSKRKLILFSNNQKVKEYCIALGRNPKGAKHFEGDLKTPEGIYYIDSKNPNSSCYLNLGISYPSKQDMAYAKECNKKPGGHIKIHGLMNGKGYIGKFHRWQDWTLGCIAVTNKEIKELYDHVQVGTPIEIKP